MKWILYLVAIYIFGGIVVALANASPAQATWHMPHGACKHWTHVTKAEQAQGIHRQCIVYADGTPGRGASVVPLRPPTPQPSTVSAPAARYGPAPITPGDDPRPDTPDVTTAATAIGSDDTVPGAPATVRARAGAQALFCADTSYAAASCAFHRYRAGEAVTVTGEVQLGGVRFYTVMAPAYGDGLMPGYVAASEVAQTNG